MRVLGLDVGDIRIGVALSDPTRTIATPLKTIIRKQEDSSVLLEISSVAKQYGAVEIVVGAPISLSGRYGKQAKKTALFIKSLAKQVTVPIVQVDERYSTIQAERLLRASGVEPSKDRARLDAAAAAVILQSYLDSNRTSHS